MALILDGTDGITSSGGTNVLQDASVEMSNLNATGNPGAGNFLRGDGAWETAGSPPGTLELLQEDIFTTSGTFTKATGFDANDTVMIFLIGGGGSGHAFTETSTNTQASAVGGAAGSAMVMATRYADVSTSAFTLTAGAGGAGVTSTSSVVNAVGIDGSTSILTLENEKIKIQANGGRGGSAAGGVASRRTITSRANIVNGLGAFVTSIDVSSAFNQLVAGHSQIIVQGSSGASNDSEYSSSSDPADFGFYPSQVVGSGGCAARQNNTNRTSWNAKTPALFNTGGNGNGSGNGQNATGIGGGGGAAANVNANATSGAGHAGGMVVRYYRGRVSPWQVLGEVGE